MRPSVLHQLFLCLFLVCGCPLGTLGGTYADGLSGLKRNYPFNSKWKNNYRSGLRQYSPRNRAKATAIVNTLIDGLIGLGSKADENRKIALFKAAVLALNRLNAATDHSLIETEERDELVTLFNSIATAANIDYRKYGHGEGPAGEWRDW